MSLNLLSRTVALLITSSISVTLCLFRLWLRKWRAQRFTQGDYWIMLALVFVPVDIGAQFYMNFRGLSLQKRLREQNEPTVEEALAQLTPGELETLVTAGRLLILHRVALCIIMWSLKMAVVDLLRSLTREIWYYRQLLHCLCAILLATFIAAFTLACMGVYVECRPADVYWLAHRAYGDCINDNMWLIAYEVGNIISNALLVLFPFPVLFNSNVAPRKRLFLSVVLGLGTFLVAVNCVRLYRGMIQQNPVYTGRFIWSSIELIIAVVVTTLPTIYVLLRPSFRRFSSNSLKEESRDNEVLPPSQVRWDHEKIPERVGEGRVITYDYPPLEPPPPVMDRNPLRRSSMPWSPGRRVPQSTPNPLAGDTWGRSRWSGGSELDTRITGGVQNRRHSVVVVMNEHACGDSSSSMAAIGRARRGSRVGVCGAILVETEVEQEFEVVSPADSASFVTPPPLVAHFPHDSLV